MEKIKMKIEALKADCLKQIKKETELEQAREAANNQAMSYYHCGRKQVWLEVHNTLVNQF